MKFVVGVVRAKPGKRAKLLEAFLTLAVATRKEAGCTYFEVAPSPEDPDLILFAECYESDEAHRAHQELAHHAEFQATAPVLAEHTKLDMIVTESTEHIDVRFD